MTVCITGDVHHMSLGTRDQEYLDERTEVDCALKYARVAAEYDVPVTLFVTGKCVVEEPEKVRHLGKMDNVEIGGHNYWAFDTLVHKASRGLFGSWNGPRLFQAWEIDRTIEAFADHGFNVTVWRDHAYRHDQNTSSLLSERGITHFSDAVGPDEGARTENGLLILPINTPPDHEHVYHAFRTKEFVGESDFEGPFGTESYGVDGWVDWVRDLVVEAVDSGHPATVLAHPSCMNLADGLTSFKNLCAQVAEDHEPRRVSDVPHDI